MLDAEDCSTLELGEVVVPQAAPAVRQAPVLKVAAAAADCSLLSTFFSLCLVNTGRINFHLEPLLYKIRMLMLS